jgi:four helix bundle protein
LQVASWAASPQLWVIKFQFMGRIDSFEELECWKACREVRIFVSQNIIPRLPPEERYRLASQLLRSARSTTANIAEGFGRRHYLDNAKFIRNSLGSLHETLDHMITAKDESLIDEGTLDQFRKLFECAVGLTRGYANYLQKKGSS